MSSISIVFTDFSHKIFITLLLYVKYNIVITCPNTFTYCNGIQPLMCASHNFVFIVERIWHLEIPPKQIDLPHFRSRLPRASSPLAPEQRGLKTMS